MSFGYHFHVPSSTSGARSLPTFVEKFEAGRSFDVEDDFAFIPELCTEEERIMMDSGSDRSSTSSGSPQSSPLQHQVQPSPAYPHASAYGSGMFPNMLKYPTPVPSRQRNAIPIVNPSTGMRVSSPPLASPGRVGTHSLSRRAW